jgi:hypothetical protein
MSLTEGLYRNPAGRNGIATFRGKCFFNFLLGLKRRTRDWYLMSDHPILPGPTQPPPHPTVAALCRRGRRDRRRRRNRMPPSGVGTPPRPREGAQGVLGRRGRDAAEDADEQARPTCRIRLAWMKRVPISIIVSPFPYLNRHEDTHVNWSHHAIQGHKKNLCNAFSIPWIVSELMHSIMPPIPRLSSFFVFV